MWQKTVKLFQQTQLVTQSASSLTQQSPYTLQVWLQQHSVLQCCLSMVSLTSTEVITHTENEFSICLICRSQCWQTGILIYMTQPIFHVCACDRSTADVFTIGKQFFLRDTNSWLGMGNHRLYRHLATCLSASVAYDMVVVHRRIPKRFQNFFIPFSIFMFSFMFGFVDLGLDFDALYGRDNGELVRFWGEKVRSQGHNNKCGHIGNFEGHAFRRQDHRQPLRQRHTGQLFTTEDHLACMCFNN